MTGSLDLDENRSSLLEGALEGGAAVTEPAEFRHAIRYVLGWEDQQGRRSSQRGKRVRPALCLAICELVGGRIEDALPAAVAVEFIHNFSLVHDEIQDQDSERHGKPTAWKRFGSAQAINVGDALYSIGTGSLSEGSAPPELRLRCAGILSAAVGAMVTGQWRDLSFERQQSISEADYFAMVTGKTGALMGAAAEMGAVLGGADPSSSAALAQWARRIGVAFQVQDDYLGIWGDPDVTGKSNTGDIARRKKSLPIVFALSDASSREIILAEYARPQDQEPDASAVLGALASCGAEVRTRETADRWADDAEKELREVGFDATVCEHLASIGATLAHRRR